MQYTTFGPRIAYCIVIFLRVPSESLQHELPRRSLISIPDSRKPHINCSTRNPQMARNIYTMVYARRGTTDNSQRCNHIMPYAQESTSHSFFVVVGDGIYTPNIRYNIRYVQYMYHTNSNNSNRSNRSNRRYKPPSNCNNSRIQSEGAIYIQTKSP